MAENQEQQASDIIVNGTIIFRNRTEDPNPVLSYDLEYFQRFEPVSVGEMLKRVPGVTFTSDVLEYDAVQFRGLPPGYTQVLINGRRAPGGEADRSFFVDRIPAELVEKIEIIRSPRADQPSEGVAGTLNIVTKEAATFEGGFAKAGALINKDGTVRPSLGAAYAGRIGENTSYWGALNYQERRNAKKKVSLRFKKFTTGSLDETDPAFKNTELQDDTRDGSDLSGSAEIRHDFGGKSYLRLQGFFVDTNRDENEVSSTFKGSGLSPDGVELQHEDIKQQTYAVNADGAFDLGGGQFGIAAGWSGYREDTNVRTDEGDSVAEAELAGTETLNIKDDEYTGTLSYSIGQDTLRFKAGIDLLDKTRNGANLAFDEDGEPDDLLAGSVFRIREKRYDPYARLTFEPTSTLTIDAGLRYEITRRNVLSNEEDSTALTQGASYNAQSLNPSLHLRYAPTDADQFRASVARTVRRPDYDLITPYDQEETPGDEDVTRGNPALRNERAWGVDLGYERRLGGRGIFGVNFFYRDITDVIELVSLGSIGDGQLFTPRNIGDGKTWGFEVDLSTPLTVIGMPDTGLFANYTYLDSEVVDPFTTEKRRFNNQPHHVYNIGFIQTLKKLDASFGATVSGRSKATESNFDQTVELKYDPDLEAFVEKRLGKHFVLRFSVQDILRRSKKEAFLKYDGDTYEDVLANRRAGTVKEYELERENSGPLYQVTLRAAF
ncbi:TonB-dependent receptor [Sphingomonas sp. So64.6b]|uniref:TonB-dependent receptor plug domain-containing protein n=1 Tax=Sphingomonas sp. So64.6b TaxID=2997354 RepID=UPI0015FF6AD2|nr:TonB-dependent receptor [Sphingomonas sp. So64.6b]QNA84879.1 TonB-dependent receptor [Sphingomonas sp. So64.6b]